MIRMTSNEFWTPLLVDDNLAQEMLLIATIFVELALVGNLIYLEGCEAAVIVRKESPSTCWTLSELRPALLADDVACWTGRNW